MADQPPQPAHSHAFDFAHAIIHGVQAAAIFFPAAALVLGTGHGRLTKELSATAIIAGVRAVYAGFHH